MKYYKVQRDRACCYRICELRCKKCSLNHTEFQTSTLTLFIIEFMEYYKVQRNRTCCYLICKLQCKK